MRAAPGGRSVRVCAESLASSPCIFSAARAGFACRIRIPAAVMWRLEGRTDLRGAVATAAGLALPLSTATWVGRARVGVILTLPIVLIAIPFDVPLPPALNREPSAQNPFRLACVAGLRTHLTRPATRY